PPRTLRPLRRADVQNARRDITLLALARDRRRRYGTAARYQCSSRSLKSRHHRAGRIQHTKQRSAGRTTMLTKRALLAGMAATGFGLATQPALAQAYPTRPVKIIVPLPAGSAPDVRHRLIAQALTQLWGQQVIVENRPGGGGIIGTRAMLGDQPDGHTLLAALASIYMILPAQNEKLPFDVNKDMIAVGLTAFEGLVMACSPKLGVSSL